MYDRIDMLMYFFEKPYMYFFYLNFATFTKSLDNLAYNHLSNLFDVIFCFLRETQSNLNTGIHFIQG